MTQTIEDTFYGMCGVQYLWPGTAAGCTDKAGTRHLASGYLSCATCASSRHYMSTNRTDTKRPSYAETPDQSCSAGSDVVPPTCSASLHEMPVTETSAPDPVAQETTPMPC